MNKSNVQCASTILSNTTMELQLPLARKNSRFLFGNEIWILIILEYTEVQWILFCPYLQIHTNTCFFHFQSWECQQFNLILSLKERFLEWVEHPLQTILLSAIACLCILSFTKRTLLTSHFRRDSFVMPGLISYDTNVSLCVMKCPCGWPMLGRCCDPPDQHLWAGRDEPEGAKPLRPLALSRGDPGVQRGFPYPGFAGVSAGASVVSLPVTPLNRDSVSGVGALDSAEHWKWEEISFWTQFQPRIVLPGFHAWVFGESER